MIICIENVIQTADLELILNKLKKAEFVDGKLTAGWYAKEVKNNLQLSSNSDIILELQEIINQALEQEALFQSAIKPKKIRPILFSRYQPGMYYDYHIDNVIMGEEDRMRSDVSLTLFLSDPNSYEGGELVIDHSLGEQSFKLDAGSMIVYPSTTLHRVDPVTSGERFVAVTWVQSLVRDAGDREILFDLDTTRKSIYQKYGKTTEFDLLSKSHANLLRKWADI